MQEWSVDDGGVNCRGGVGVCEAVRDRISEGRLGIGRVCRTKASENALKTWLCVSGGRSRTHVVWGLSRAWTLVYRVVWLWVESFWGG